jgi:2-polyprenyl-6-methoxyphenol hydroxylase-like FAD-dependent oxidoreductase
MSVNADVKTRSGPKPIDTTTKSKTGIKVLIVGAGFGGLTAAIECHLQGHSVTVLEAVKQLKPFGDGISFGANAGRIFGSWSKGYMLKRFLGHLNYYEYFDIRKYDGTRIVKQPPPERIPDAPTINGHRGEMHMEMYYYAKDILGIDIRCGCKVLKYFEDEDGAGVELGNGERMTGDVVIGSDGVKSLARKVLGYDDKPHSSGYAIFRTCFAAEEMLDDPLTREFVDYGDTFTGWAGPNVHFLFVVSKGGQMASWFLTHLVPVVREALLGY